MFFLLGIFISIFLLLLLIIKKNKSSADKLLGIWLFMILINQVLNYFLLTGVIYQYPHWLGVEFSLPVINGLMLYFYVMEITANKFTHRWHIVLHLIPAVSLILLAIPFYMLTGNEKIYVYENDAEGFEWYVIYSNILVPLSGLIYAIWSLLIIKKHRKKIQDNFSNTDKKELLWLRYLAVGFLIIWILAIFFENTIIFSAVVVLVLFIGFFGINQLNIFYTTVVEVTEATNSNKVYEESVANITKPRAIQKRYAKSGLNEDMASDIYNNLNVLMNKDGIYKNEDLTLSELAKTLNAHPNHLSQVINEREGKNFYNYINAIRIKEFIKLASLPENKKYTMISLAYDCGFGTKSTFNKHFKANTGKTPTQFFNADR